jgi:hypothetical protein
LEPLLFSPELYTNSSKIVQDGEPFLSISYQMTLAAKTPSESWPKNHDPEHVRLGPYQEQIGKYLLGESDFPERSAFMILVSDVDTPLRATSLPWGGSFDGRHHIHCFVVPGVRFNLFLGDLPNWMRETCARRSVEKFLLFSPHADELSMMDLEKVYARTRRDID